MYFNEISYLRWGDGCLLHLEHISLGLTFIIDFPSFHNGLKHLYSLKLISILKATWWKLVMKCKIVMLFILFGIFFSNYSFLRFQNFISPSIKCPVNLIFSVVVCICKIQASMFLMGNFKSYTVLDHVINILWIFLKILSEIGIIEIWKHWKY